MRVLHICDRLTPRVAKIAFAWQQLGNMTMVLYQHDCVPDLTQQILSISRYCGDAMFRAKATILAQNCDVVHVHTSINSTDLIVRVGLVSTPASLVWDIHDWTDDCEQHFTIPDAIITPSTSMQTHIHAQHDAPIETIYSKVPKAWIGDCATASHNGCTVLASLVDDESCVWRDYRQAQQLCREAGAPMFIYPAMTQPANLLQYDNMLQQLPCLRLWQQLPQYKWGWAGAANDRHTIHDCVTNKFWEYLACGVPPITWRSNEMTDIMREYYGWDADVDRVDPDYGTWNTDARNWILRDNIIKDQTKRFMQSEMPKLRKLYESL